ncbi:radical SAM protein [Halomonas sp. EF61]|uniref:radical SAM protein n=1 Tax=Halomonas sp. EF61 TaxID=2950869 RepID=UPI0032DFEF21
MDHYHDDGQQRSATGPLKGRGATYDPANRFSPTRSEQVDDGWWQEATPDRIATVTATESAKSALILRDKDLLSELASRRLVRVMVSLTSLDTELKRQLEPRTASPRARLRVIGELADAGVPVGTLVSPVIPGLTDHELERLLQAARDAGASTAGWMLLRLPREVAPLFEAWLEAHYPERAAKVMSLIRQCRNGQDYDSRFGHRMRGQGVFAELLDQRFRKACRRLGLSRRSDSRLDSGLDSGLDTDSELDTESFRAPHRQGSLF